MKKVISVIFTFLMLASLLNITAFAQTSPTLVVSLTPPQVGDTVEKSTLAITVSSADQNLSVSSYNVQDIFSGNFTSALTNVTTLEDYSAFRSENSSSNIANSGGTYSSGQYTVIFNVAVTGDLANLTLDFGDKSGGFLFASPVYENIHSVYAYIVFTPDDASDTVSNNSSAMHDVYATYQAAEATTNIYSVDIVWGSMQFKYTAPSKGTWNPESLSYINPIPEKWEFSPGSNMISVTNKSNARITAGLSYAPASGFGTVIGKFYDNSSLGPNSAITSFTLEGAAEGSASAPFKTVYLGLSGSLPASDREVTVGTVTVTIN